MNSLNWKPWVLAMITLLCILAPRSLSFLPLIPGVIGYIWLSIQNRKPISIDLPLAIFFATTVILAVISSLWAVYPDLATERACKTIGIFLGGLLLIATARNTAIKPGKGLYALFAGYIAIGFYLFADYMTLMKISSTILSKHVDYWNMNRLLVTYTLLFVPMIVMVTRVVNNNKHQLLIIAAMLVAIMLPLWKTSSQTAQVAFILSASAFAVIYFIKSDKARKFIYLLSGVILTATIMSAPYIPAPLQNALKGHTEATAFASGANTAGRLEIWNFVAGKIHEKPLLGHGVEATREMRSEVEMPVNKTHSVLHPHNAYLQIWVEMGLIGAGMASAFALFLLYRISKSAQDIQPVYFALFTSMAGTLAIGYGVWQSWQLGMIFAITAFSILLTRLQKA